ncbi:inorganic diphosphatase [Thermopetrobacter sp. TC1]|uniref:inorganic diphosphatase n=1 Tax=Thermopetrobacter sp. TC1 TaxID=1495045 RepID=UPI00056EAC54|nr:inorganic diphosphatase [Thermopetrobacter sp. TC1]
MRLDAVSPGSNPPHEVNVVIEVPIGGEPIKYEMDKAAGTMVVDRYLYTPMRYPGNYGFIPHTLCDDGDPIDVVLISSRPLIPGCIIAVRPVGVLKMRDEKGLDEKIIAVPAPHITRHYEKIFDIDDLPEIQLRQIEHFFTHYKDLEAGKWVRTEGWGHHEEAERLIMEALERARATP